jgi:hypothetical protein
MIQQEQRTQMQNKKKNVFYMEVLASSNIYLVPDLIEMMCAFIKYKIQTDILSSMIAVFCTTKNQKLSDEN